MTVIVLCLFVHVNVVNYNSIALGNKFRSCKYTFIKNNLSTLK